MGLARKKIRKNRIAGIALIAFTIYVVISITLIRADIRERKDQIQELQNQIDDQVILNEEMQDVLDKGINDNYIIRVAREKLKMVFPEERVYKDIHKDATGN